MRATVAQVKISPATKDDLGAVLRLLSDARQWHQDQGVDVWQAFDPGQIGKDISAQRVFVAKIAGSTCGTITLVESDPLVWGRDEQDDAIYIHKLAASRTMVGMAIGARLIRWARSTARRRGRKWLRLDTWNGNRKMREYYERQGFRHVRDEFFALDSPMADDYRGTFKSLYQLEV